MVGPKPGPGGPVQGQPYARHSPQSAHAGIGRGQQEPKARHVRRHSPSFLLPFSQLTPNSRIPSPIFRTMATAVDLRVDEIKQHLRTLEAASQVSKTISFEEARVADAAMFEIEMRLERAIEPPLL